MRFAPTFAAAAAFIGAVSAQDPPSPTDPALLSDLASLSDVFASISEQLASEGGSQIMSILPIPEASAQTTGGDDMSLPAFLPTETPSLLPVTDTPSLLPTDETPSLLPTEETPSLLPTGTGPESDGASTPQPTPTETGAAAAVAVPAWMGLGVLGVMGLL